MHFTSSHTSRFRRVVTANECVSLCVSCVRAGVRVCVCVNVCV